MSSSQPVSFTIHRITDLDDPRIEGTVKVLEEAFRDDKIHRAMVGGHVEYGVPMFRGIIPGYILGGHCYVAVDAAGEVVGTVTFYPPDCEFYRDEPSKKALEPFFEEMKKLYPGLCEYWHNTLMPAYWDVARFFPEPDPTRPGNYKFQNWNFMGFAVTPRLQGRGIGKALLQVGIDEAKKANGVVCVETESEKQMQMYQHLGFRCVGTEFVEGPEPHLSYHQRALIMN